MPGHVTNYTSGYQRRKFYNYARNKRIKKRRSYVTMRRRQPRLNLRTSLPSFPTNKVVEMRYSCEYTLDPVSGPGGIDENFILANGLYRPDQSDAIMRNAMGYNQWGAFYERYTVLSSKIEVSWVNTVSDPATPSIVGIQLTDSQDPVPTLSELLENRATKYAMMQNITNGNMINKQKAFYNAKRWHGVVDVADVEELDADFIVTQQQADEKDPEPVFFPRDPTYYRIYCMGNDDAINSNKVNCRVLVVYRVLVKDPRLLPTSATVIPTPP